MNRFMRRHRGPLLATALGALLGIASSASGQTEAIAPESWVKPWTWWNDEKIAQWEDSMRSIQNAVTVAATVTAVVFVASSAFGPLLVEWARRKFLVQLKFTPDQVKGLVVTGFCAALTCLLGLTFGSKAGQALILPVLIIVAGSIYDLRSSVLPSIELGERERLKAGLSRIKTAFLLALVFIIALQMILDGQVNPNVDS